MEPALFLGVGFAVVREEGEVSTTAGAGARLLRCTALKDLLPAAGFNLWTGRRDGAGWGDERGGADGRPHGNNRLGLSGTPRPRS
jgi:hypothetical protein